MNGPHRMRVLVLTSAALWARRPWLASLHKEARRRGAGPFRIPAPGRAGGP